MSISDAFSYLYEAGRLITPGGDLSKDVQKKAHDLSLRADHIKGFLRVFQSNVTVFQGLCDAEAHLGAEIYNLTTLTDGKVPDLHGMDAIFGEGFSTKATVAPFALILMRRLILASRVPIESVISELSEVLLERGAITEATQLFIAQRLGLVFGEALSITTVLTRISWVILAVTVVYNVFSSVHDLKEDDEKLNDALSKLEVELPKLDKNIHEIYGQMNSFVVSYGFDKDHAVEFSHASEITSTFNAEKLFSEQVDELTKYFKNPELKDENFHKALDTFSERVSEVLRQVQNLQTQVIKTMAELHGKFKTALSLFKKGRSVEDVSDLLDITDLDLLERLKSADTSQYDFRSDFIIIPQPDGTLVVRVMAA